MEFTRKRRYLLSLLSGLLMVVAFPYTGSLTPLIFVAWIPLLLVDGVILEQKHHPSNVYIHALITFLIFNVGTSWWIWNASAEGAVLAILVNTILMSLLFLLFHLTRKFVGSKQGYIGLLFYWMAFEHMHFHWDIAWPWLTLGNYFSIFPSWVQWYSYTGAQGGTLWILIINLLLFRALFNILVRKETRIVQTPLFWLAGIGIAIPMLISLITYFSYEEKGKPIDVLVIQNNVDPYSKFSLDPYSQVDVMMNMISKKIDDKTDLVLLPETCLADKTLRENNIERDRMYNYIVNKLNQVGVDKIHLGSFTLRMFDTIHSDATRHENGVYYEIYNSSLFMQRDKPVQLAHKSKLVPGIELIPFSELFPFLAELAKELDGPQGSLGVDEIPVVFKSKEFNFAPVVCYESAFGDHVATQCRLGAQFISIITNDGWWGDTPGYKQHQSFASLRAIENRRSVARSANTGSSCFVNQRGDILQATAWWEPAIIKGQIHCNTEVTFYTKYGDVMGRVSKFVFLLLLLYTFVSWFKLKFIKH